MACKMKGENLRSNFEIKQPKALWPNSKKIFKYIRSGESAVELVGLSDSQNEQRMKIDITDNLNCFLVQRTLAKCLSQFYASKISRGEAELSQLCAKD